MSQFDYKEFYERNRPHIHPPDATLFVTFRLAGSIPKAVLRKYRAEKEWLDNELKRINSPTAELAEKQAARWLEFHRIWFRKFEDILHAAKNSPMWLEAPDIRRIIAEKIEADATEKYRLAAYSIMSNHVHIVFKPNLSARNLHEEKTAQGLRFKSEEETLAQIMQSLKGVTARAANLALNRSGAFWEHESYDHFVRNEDEYWRIIKYTLDNPVKARLVQNWQDWAGNYLAPGLSGRF